MVGRPIEGQHSGHIAERPARSGHVIGGEITAHTIGPGLLAPSGLVEHPLAARCEVEKGGAFVVGVGSDLDETIGHQAVGQPLHALTAQTHAASHPGHRGRPFPEPTQDLPAGAGETEIGHQVVGRRHQMAVDPEQLKNQLGEAQTAK